MSSIFRDNAPLYWAVGLPVIPLKRWNSPGKGAGKAPILNEWTQYGEVMPTEAMRASWTHTYPDSNIGLPFGPASGLCAIDIDTEDKEIQDAIEKVLPGYPNFPWRRVGKKGVGLLFRWQGQPNFKLRNSDNESIVEFLGKGNQMVMPPSIHPQTERPYVADSNLYEVLSLIPVLPVDIEQTLRDALEPILGKKGFSLAQAGRSGPLDVIPQGERDIQLVRHAGYTARIVLGFDKRFAMTLKEGMEHMATWVSDFTAGASGDDMDPEKGVAKLLEFLLNDVENGATLPSNWDDGLTAEQLAHPAIAGMAEKNETQRWGISRANTYILDVIEPIADIDKQFDKVAQFINNLAHDDKFEKAQFARVIDLLIKSTPELGFNKVDLNRMFKEAKLADQEIAEDHEAIAREAIEVLSRGGDIRFDLGQPWQWSGSCFNPLDERDLYDYIAKNVKGNQLARRHNDYIAITKTMLNLTRAPLETQPEIGINFANGFLDSNLKLHDHDMKYGKTFTMPFNYIPERADEAHKFFKFLEDSWGDDEDYSDKVNALQEAMAATMFGVGTQYQRVILLHGKPKTGKSQMLEIMQAMMPTNARAAIAPTDWNEKFFMAGMTGKTLNVCGELPEEGVISGSKFKMVVAGEEITDSFKNKDNFKFRPIATHWFASNFLPRTRDTSGGFLRRWLILDFNKVVADEDRIVDFWKTLVAEEREAIAAWAVKGLARLQKQADYTQPESHKVRLAQVMRANNSVAAFLSWTDKVRKDETGTHNADARAVFDHYLIYMKDISKGWSVTYERFTQMLNDLGYETTIYHDQLGTPRQKVVGLRVVGPQLPGQI